MGEVDNTDKKFISKFKIDDKTYEVKDAKARQMIEELRAKYTNFQYLEKLI